MKFMRFYILLLLLCIVLKGNAQQLVLPGDHPDPSVVKMGNEYWATATTSNWFPAFTLYRSTDLVNWKSEGHVFLKMPEWADYYMWAPEITYDKGKVYIYYTAHKKGGGLCIAVAVADKPEGPYTDIGPLMCDMDGSIDAFPMRDEHGKLYLIWKEDGNSIGMPTPIWAAPMKEDRTELIGEKRELFRATATWEKGLVEGVSIIREHDYFYAFYAAAACCGKSCNYGTGIARSKSLLGPWEKYPGNPVLMSDGLWKCPGHGTPVKKDGRFYFLYHAYSNAIGNYGGRQGLLNEFEFLDNGWIRFLNTKEYNGIRQTKKIVDYFLGTKLNDSWQWSIFQNVHYTISKNVLRLNALPIPCGAYLGRSVLADNYTAEIEVQKESTSQSGLALIGDDKNMVYVSVYKGEISLVQLKKDKPETMILQKKIKIALPITFKLTVNKNIEATFMYSTNGSNFKILNDKPIDISYLPPWDRAVRVGLMSKGAEWQTAVFKKFVLNNE